MRSAMISRETAAQSDDDSGGDFTGSHSGTSVAPSFTAATPVARTEDRAPWCAFSSYSPNVAFTLWYTFVDGACYSLWGMQLLPLYLKEITSHTSAIGLASTVSGVAQLHGALGAGYVADRVSRQLCIRAGALCAAAALLVFLTAFVSSSYLLVFVGQALWGLYTGITSTSVEALFADSVPQGRRTTIYNAKWMLQTLCYVVGYAIAAVLFVLWHNSWEAQKMRAVLVVGILAHAIALVPLCWLRDRYAEHEAAEGAETTGIGGVTAAATVTTSLTPAASVEGKVKRDGGDGGVPLKASATRAVLDGGDNGSLHLSSQRNFTDPQQQEQELPQQEGNQLFPDDWSRSERDDAPFLLSAVKRWCTTHFRAGPGGLTSLAMVPYWMCAVDLALAIGSGMSLPFFSPFFVDNCGVSPAGLYGIFISATVLTAATSSILPWLITSCRVGRIPAVIGVRVAGTTALLLLATARRGTTLDSLPATVGLFLCRNALMNSVFGLTRSVVMDCVARSTRARWSAFESVTSLSWAGSAALGGLITEAHSYKLNFKITAVLQLLATLLMIPAALGARELDAAPPPISAATATTADDDGVNFV